MKIDQKRLITDQEDCILVAEKRQKFWQPRFQQTHWENKFWQHPFSVRKHLLIATMLSECLRRWWTPLRRQPSPFCCHPRSCFVVVVEHKKSNLEHGKPNASCCSVTHLHDIWAVLGNRTAREKRVLFRESLMKKKQLCLSFHLLAWSECFQLLRFPGHSFSRSSVKNELGGLCCIAFCSFGKLLTCRTWSDKWHPAFKGRESWNMCTYECTI